MERRIDPVEPRPRSSGTAGPAQDQAAVRNVFMPGMNGPQTCQAIRHQLREPICHIPVIGLTASTHAQDRQLCLEAGMNEVLPKPMDKVGLAATVNSLVHAAMSSKAAHAL